jgi:hypothetical protein
LLVAGVVGAVRRTRERAAVERGTAAPVGPATRIVPSSGQGRLARRVGNWAPRRPATAGGRVAAYLWASPATLVGAVVAVTTGGTARWDHEHGCAVVEGGGRGSAALLRALGFSANAIGHVVVSTRDRTSPVLLAHEAGHVRQAERLGPLLLPLYVWWWARYGYRDHPLERSAREAARRWMDTRP